MSRTDAAARQAQRAALIKATLSTGQIATVIDALDAAIVMEATRFDADTEIGAKLRAANQLLNQAHNLACARGRAL